MYKAGEIPRLGLNEIEIWGTALFDGDKMVEELNGEETRTLLIIRGEFKRAFYTIQDPLVPKVVIPLDVTGRSKPKVKINFQKGKPHIDLELFLDADIIAIQSNIHYETVKMKKLVEKVFAERIIYGTYDLLLNCKSLGIDPFKFGDYATKKFLTINEMEKYNWNNQFKDVSIDVNVSVIIRRTGTIIRSSKIIGPDGKPQVGETK